MAGCSDAFKKAAEEVKNLTKRPSDDEMLQTYGLYKQATKGDNNTEGFSAFSIDLKGKAKWKAWDAKKGMDKATAEAEYITLVEELLVKYPK